MASRDDARDAGASGRAWTRGERLILVCLIAATGLVLFTANRGFGLTDEAFYVAWIADPTRFDVSITPFGPPLHLVFVALGRSIIALRLFGVALLLASGALLGASLGRYYHRSGLPCSTRALASLGALSALTYYALWILTPSYNLLANAGGAVILAGALEWLIADQDARASYFRGAALIGMGGCIAFFGKPPLAAVMGLAVAAMMAHSTWAGGVRRVLPPVLIAAGFALLPLVALVQTSVGVDVFIRSITAGIAVLDFGNSPLTTPIRFVRELLLLPMLLVAVVVTALAVAWSRDGAARRDERRRLRVTFIVILLLVLGHAALLLLGGFRRDHDLWSFIGQPAACAALVVISVCALLGRRPVPPARALIPLIALMAVPFATALGSANLLIYQIGMSVYPFFMAAAVAGVIFLAPGGQIRVQAATALFATLVVFAAATRPYALVGTIFAETEPVSLPFTRDTLRVAPETRDYLAGLRRLSSGAGLNSTTPVIDLSPGGPGTVLLLDARAPLYPWLLPQTRTEGALADHAWNALDDDARRATWIVGPVQPAFGATKLAAFLRRNQSCYRRVASLRKFFWEELKPIQLWAPVRGCRFRP